MAAPMWLRLRAARSVFRSSRAAHRYSTSPAPDAHPARASPSPASAFTRQFLFRLFGLATWVPVAIWFNSTVAEITRIEGPSMYPFLNSNYNESLERDWVVNRKLYAQDGLERGMVVFLKSPYNPEVVSVKRVIALAGDVVQTQPPFKAPYVRVPEGHVWVEGDAGEGRSLDSNTYGPVSVALITGRLTHIVLPLSKFGRVRWWEYPVAHRTAS